MRPSADLVHPGRPPRRRLTPRGLVQWVAAVPLVTALAVALVGCSEDPTGEGPPPAATATTAPTVTGPTTTVVLDPARLPVVVTAEEVPAGTSAEQAIAAGLLVSDTRPFTAFPEDAVVTLDLLEGLVAAEDLMPGTVLTAGDFVAPDGGAGSGSASGSDAGSGDDEPSNDESPPATADGDS